MVERFKDLLTLYVPGFRRVVLFLVPVSAVSLLVIAPFVDAFNQDLGFKVAIAALLFFIAVLVEHVANNVTKLGNLTTTVGQLETGIQVIESTVGVREGLEVHETDYMASRRQLEIIDNKNPRRVKLFEYSSGTVRGQLLHLASHETTESVELLVCHPNQAINKYQREQRILNQLTALSNSVKTEAAERMGLKIKCYERPASIRGRHYNDQFVIIGWYTYDSQPQSSDSMQQSSDSLQIWGEENPVIIAPQSHPHGKYLAAFFDKVFVNIWQDAIPLREAVSGYAGKHNMKSEWLEQVSEVELRR